MALVDAATIFTRGGLVLWSFKMDHVDDGLFNSLVRDILLEEKTAVNNYSTGGFNLRWKLANELNIIYAVAYQGIASTSFMDSILDNLHAVIQSETSSSPDIASLDLSSLDFRALVMKADKQSKVAKKAPTAISPDQKKKIAKEGRAWDLNKVSASAAQGLDFSKQGESIEAKVYLPDDAETEPEPVRELSGGFFAKMTLSIQGLIGNKQLSSSDLAPILRDFQNLLVTKNVAIEVAEKIASSVEQNLIGAKTQSYTTVHQTVKAALTLAIQTILTPKKSIDVLKAALDAKEAGNLFSIAFIGVNGVGKSTNLAKVAYHLKTKGGLKVLIAACDTFRSGAVEQLRTHSKCLEIDLFEKGYGKDASEIAKQALAYASKNNFDVVLIDTAGRMQDNEPLMRSIAKLTAVNNPDLILFVGEALVGYDAIDQLSKFNSALIEFSDKSKGSRGIDGILLTKFDTVDDKVGAAVSMVYMTGQPVVFVGTGQKYTNLKKLQVDEVVAALLS